MGKHVKRFSVQLNPEISPRLTAWCKDHDRSLSWAINHLTDKALDAEGYPAADSTPTDTHPCAPETGRRKSLS